MLTERSEVCYVGNYAITVDFKMAYYASPVDYEYYLRWLWAVRRIELDSYVLEVSSNGTRDKLHLHGIYHAKKPIHYSNLKLKGYHVYIKAIPLGQIENWVSYIHKDDPFRVMEYTIAHFWDMSEKDYDFDDKHRSCKPGTNTNKYVGALLGL